MKTVNLNPSLLPRLDVVMTSPNHNINRRYIDGGETQSLVQMTLEQAACHVGFAPDRVERVLTTATTHPDPNAALPLD